MNDLSVRTALKPILSQALQIFKLQRLQQRFQASRAAYIKAACVALAFAVAGIFASDYLRVLLMAGGGGLVMAFTLRAWYFDRLANHATRTLSELGFKPE